MVTVADDGGSSGRLRRELGVLPPGDLRMALAALCGDDDWGRTWSDLVQHRFRGDGELRGHAKGVIAIGDFATGFVALGGLARGVVAIGGLAAGLFSVGGLSIGLLSAFGGLAIGALAVGGGAFGAVAVGGGAGGYYACGGGAAGTHVVSAIRRDPEAVQFFSEHGFRGLCPASVLRQR